MPITRLSFRNRVVQPMTRVLMAAPDQPTFAGLGETVANRVPTVDRPLRIALLEDDELDAELISRQLATAWPSGVEVRRFERLADFEAGLAEAEPDIVFCDLSVPDAEGIELVERAVGLVATAPIVVLTGSDDPALPVLALEIGAQDYLSKGGFDAELLARTLRHSMARSRADEALRQAALDLQATNTELEEYLGIMAHDLRGPLRTGRLFTDRLLHRYRNGQDGEVIAEALDASLARMEAMIERLLLLATLREGRPEPATVRLSDVVERAASDLRAELAAVGGRYRVEHDGPILIDHELFVDLLYHLVQNSIGYRSPDRPLEIVFGTETVGSSTLVTIRDNGIGIAPEYRDRVFRLFERLDPHASPGALGFGLACCRRIVELHRGAITIGEPPTGVGTEISIQLPTDQVAMLPQRPGPTISARPETSDS